MVFNSTTCNITVKIHLPVIILFTLVHTLATPSLQNPKIQSRGFKNCEFRNLYLVSTVSHVHLTSICEAHKNCRTQRMCQTLVTTTRWSLCGHTTTKKETVPTQFCGGNCPNPPEVTMGSNTNRQMKCPSCRGQPNGD